MPVSLKAALYIVVTCERKHVLYLFRILPKVRSLTATYSLTCPLPAKGEYEARHHKHSRTYESTEFAIQGSTGGRRLKLPNFH